MPISLLVVDDFLDNAIELRQAGLRLTYPRVESTYPGCNSQQRINIEGLDRQISKLVGEPLVPLPPPQAHGKFRIALAGDSGKARVHVDPAHWTGLLYLSRPEDCRGGTELFRHLPTNSDRAPFDDAEARAMGGTDAKTLTGEILQRDTLDASKWEMTMRIPMRFNRLVLLRPWQWHTAGESFGDCMDNGRLIYLMFYESAAR